MAQLLERGWARETVIGIAGRLAGFAMRVDITAASGVTATQIEAAAVDWMKQSRHYFRRAIVALRLFLLRRGGPVQRPLVKWRFKGLREYTGVKRVDGAHYQPRLHDLRHSFAVRRLISWY